MNYQMFKTQLQSILNQPPDLIKNAQMELLKNHNLAPYELQSLLFEKLLEEEVCHYYLSSLREGLVKELDN